MLKEKVPNKFTTYVKNIVVTIVAFPVAVVIATGLVICALLLLPIIWFAITLIWVNMLRQRIYKI